MRRHKALLLVGIMMIIAISFAGCTKSDPYEKVKYEDVMKLAEYKGLEYPKGEDAPKEEDVDAYIKSLLEKNAQSEKITDTSVTVENGDAVNIKFVGTIDGKEFEGGKSENFDMVLGETPMIDGFSDGIVGHKIGETFTLDLKFPEGYHAKNLAGKPVKFEITINSKDKKSTPELTDKWVTDNTKFKTVDEYKASVKDELIKKADKYQKFQTRGMLLQKIVKNTKFKKMPEDLLNAEVEKSKKILDKVILSKQKIKFEDYAKTIYAQDKSVKNPAKKLEKQLKLEAENVTKKKLVVYAIAKKEGIKVSDKEIEDKFVQSIKELNMNVKDFEKQYDISQNDAKELFDYRSMVFEEKVGDKIASLGKEK